MLLVLGPIQKILDCCEKSKECNICDYDAQRFTSTEPHVCSKNHLLGSSKLMECDAGIKMAIKVVHTYQVFYTTMIWDDDSTISGNCKWSYKVYYYKIYCLNGQKTTMAQKGQTMDAFHYTSTNRFFYWNPPTEIITSRLPVT